MSIKRSKILLLLSILVITIFILTQFLFQQSNLIPKLPGSIFSIAKDGNNNVKEPDKPMVPNQPIQSQVTEGLNDPGVFKSSIVIDQVNVSQILEDVFIGEKQLKPEGTNVTPEEHKVIEEIKPEEAKLDESKTFTIVLWTNFFEDKDYIKEEAWKPICVHTNCIFTSDRDAYHQADALIFHARDINVADLPIPPRNPHQRWVYLNHEAPSNTAFQPVAALDGLVNWTVTYRLGSDITLSPTFIPAPSVIPEIPINHVRPGMVSWLVSNCQTASNRESYVNELKKHIPVDIYGACGNLTCLPKMSNQCYDTLASKYYFYLSFENSLCTDYVTEKFFAVANHPIVPIVFGGADYSRMAPPNSYIDALSFESPAKLAHYLHHLTRNPAEYDVYFNWKRYYIQTYSHYACEICSALNQPEQSSKTWNHLSQWWFEEAKCKRWINGKLVPWKSY